MDTYISEYLQFPWQLRAAVGLAIGLLLAIVLLSIPERVLVRMSFTKGLTENCITLYRIPIYMIGAWIYFHMGLPEIGFDVIVVACTLDRIDGAEAAARARSEQRAQALGIPIVLRTERSKALGKFLDPFGDKVTLLPTMAYQAHLGAMQPWIIGAIITIDIIGTFVNRGASNGFGKAKYLCQAFALIACVPHNQHWSWSGDTLAPNTLAALSIPFAIASIVFRGMKNPPRFVTRFTAVFARNSAPNTVTPPDRV